MLENLPIDFIVVNNQQSIGPLRLYERLNHCCSSTAEQNVFSPYRIRIKRVPKTSEKIFMKYFMLYVKHMKIIQLFTDILFNYHIIMLLLSVSPKSRSIKK